jgi:hypothetical protein
MHTTKNSNKKVIPRIMVDLWGHHHCQLKAFCPKALWWQFHWDCPGQVHKTCDRLRAHFVIYGASIPGQEGNFDHFDHGGSWRSQSRLEKGISPKFRHKVSCWRLHWACPRQVHAPCDGLTAHFVIFSANIPGQEGYFHHAGFWGSLTFCQMSHGDTCTEPVLGKFMRPVMGWELISSYLVPIYQDKKGIFIIMDFGGCFHCQIELAAKCILLTFTLSSPGHVLAPYDGLN